MSQVSYTQTTLCDLASVSIRLSGIVLKRAIVDQVKVTSYTFKILSLQQPPFRFIASRFHHSADLLTPLCSASVLTARHLSFSSLRSTEQPRRQERCGTASLVSTTPSPSPCLELSQDHRPRDRTASSLLLSLQKHISTVQSTINLLSSLHNFYSGPSSHILLPPHLRSAGSSSPHSASVVLHNLRQDGPPQQVIVSQPPAVLSLEESQHKLATKRNPKPQPSLLRALRSHRISIGNTINRLCDLHKFYTDLEQARIKKESDYLRSLRKHRISVRTTINLCTDLHRLYEDHTATTLSEDEEQDLIKKAEFLRALRAHRIFVATTLKRLRDLTTFYENSAASARSEEEEQGQIRKADFLRSLRTHRICVGNTINRCQDLYKLYGDSVSGAAFEEKQARKDKSQLLRSLGTHKQTTVDRPQDLNNSYKDSATISQAQEEKDRIKKADLLQTLRHHRIFAKTLAKRLRDLHKSKTHSPKVASSALSVHKLILSNVEAALAPRDLTKNAHTVLDSSEGNHGQLAPQHESGNGMSGKKTSKSKAVVSAARNTDPIASKGSPKGTKVAQEKAGSNWTALKKVSKSSPTSLHGVMLTTVHCVWWNTTVRINSRVQDKGKV